MVGLVAVTIVSATRTRGLLLGRLMVFCLAVGGVVVGAGDPPLPAGTRLSIQSRFDDRTVVENLTAAQTQSPGYFQFYRFIDHVGDSSNLNVDGVGQVRPNSPLARSLAIPRDLDPFRVAARTSGSVVGSS